MPKIAASLFAPLTRPVAAALLAAPAMGEISAPPPDTTPPVITSAASISLAENAPLAHALTANESVTWTKTGGADSALFTVADSTLSMSARDYESPADADANNVYVVQVTATDGAGNSASQTISVTVTNVDDTAPVITSAASIEIDEGQQLAHALTANEAVTWTIVGGNDQAQFELVGSTLRWAADGVQDYDAPADGDGDNAYLVTVQATDGAGNSQTQAVTVSVADVVEGGATPGEAATAFATAPAVHYHPHSQAVSVDGDGRLVSCPDLRGLADLFAVAGTAAPVLMTDALGRDFLRFDNSAAAIGNALAMASNRSHMVVLVGRSHHSGNTVHLVNPRFASYTSPAVNAVANASIGYLRATVISNSAPFLQGGNPAGSSNAADCHRIVPGCQLQVMAIASRTTAAGGTRLYLNNDTCDVAQQSTGVSNYVGAVVGGTGSAANSEALANTAASHFDLYELAIWAAGPATATADANVAAAVTNYAIPQLDTNLVLEGDSITYGIATDLPVSPANAGGLGSRLTEPGNSLVPGNVRVINRGASGAKVANLLTRRDTPNSLASSGRYPGGAENNLIAIQIGRNDMFDPAITSSAHYSNVVALLNTAETGYLQRGWRVAQVGNIAGTPTNLPGAPDAPITGQARIEAFRAMICSGTAINPVFAADVLAGPGQAYDGLVTVLPVHLITVAGDTAFLTGSDAGDSASGYYDSDQTHLRVAGVDLMISGGDNPAYGYASLLS